MTINCLYCSKEITQEEFDAYHGECLECIKIRFDKHARNMDQLEKKMNVQNHKVRDGKSTDN